MKTEEVEDEGGGGGGARKRTGKQDVCYQTVDTEVVWSGVKF